MKNINKTWLKRQLTISKALMFVGALWIIAYTIMTGANVIKPTIYGWIVSWPTLFLLGIFYILVPFSVIPGWWSRIWAVLLAALSLFIVIGFFVGNGVNYNNVWTYLNPLPHLLMAIGAIFWIIQG